MFKKSVTIIAAANILILIHISLGICEEQVVDSGEKSVVEKKETAPDNVTRDQQNITLTVDQEVLAELNQEERNWYTRFHEGVLFFDGWNEISNEILTSFPIGMVEGKKAIIQRLGIKIGTEWSRDNKHRKIDTAMLKEWGSKIRKAVKSGPEDTDQILREIENEVDLLLKSEDDISYIPPQS